MYLCAQNKYRWPPRYLPLHGMSIDDDVADAIWQDIRDRRGPQVNLLVFGYIVFKKCVVASWVKFIMFQSLSLCWQITKKNIFLKEQSQNNKQVYLLINIWSGIYFKIAANIKRHIL